MSRLFKDMEFQNKIYNKKQHKKNVIAFSNQVKQTPHRRRKILARRVCKTYKRSKYQALSEAVHYAPPYKPRPAGEYGLVQPTGLARLLSKRQQRYLAEAADQRDLILPFVTK